MEELIKANFQVKRPVEIAEDKEKSVDVKLHEKFKRAALNSIGGSMVYVERTQMIWDGETDSNDNK